MLDPAQAARAKKLYYDFFEAHKQSNPTDLNTEEKYEYAFEIGFEGYVLMQTARKESFAFTLYKTWVDRKNAEAKFDRECRAALAAMGPRRSAYVTVE